MHGATLPIKARPKGRPRFAVRGKFVSTYTDAKTKQYESDLRALIKESYQEAPMDGALSLTLIFNLKRPRSVKRACPTVRPDIDNYVKSVMDAANGILYHDDSQVCELICKKQYDCTDSIDIIVSSLE
jgi:Holliday junction resolvase RusA-like endonuclease